MVITGRDRYFVAIVLPLALAGLYVYFFFAPALKERARLSAYAEELGPVEILRARSEALETSLRNVRSELETARAEDKKIRETELGADNVKWSDTDNRGIAGFIKLLSTAGGISLVKYERNDKHNGGYDEDGLLLSPPEISVHDKVYGDSTSESWDIEIRASYSDFTALLTLLKERACPLSISALSMLSPDDSHLRHWSFHVRLY